MDGRARPSPAALGPVYAKLWLASLVSFMGDGVYYTALPLLAVPIVRRYAGQPVRLA